MKKLQSFLLRVATSTAFLVFTYGFIKQVQQVNYDQWGRNIFLGIFFGVYLTTLGIKKWYHYLFYFLVSILLLVFVAILLLLFGNADQYLSSMLG